MKKHEKWLYQENTISQQLFMVFLLGNTIFAIFCANNMNVDFGLGIFIMVNILLSLLSFLVAVRQKVYMLKWGIIGAALAVFQLVRLAWIPEEIITPLRFQLMALLIVSSMCAFTGSFFCLKRTRERETYIAENNIDLALLQR